jgi:hypothetical protein
VRFNSRDNKVSSISITPAHSGQVPKRRKRWNFAEWFAVSQTLLPALLYLPGSQPFRVPIRMSCYGITLVALVYLWRNRTGLRQHPSVKWLVLSMAYLGLMMLHPTTNSVSSGLAQIGIYFSVLAPVIWAPKLVESPARLERILWLLLICNGMSSVVGVLQVYDPDRWMPAEFSSVQLASQWGLGNVSYQGPDGRTIIRPPGLGDAPGAVAFAGILALFLGLVFVVTSRTFFRRGAALILAGFGAASVFLTMVRASFLIGLLMIACYLYLQVRQGRIATAATVAGLCVGTISVALLGAIALGGENILYRFSTVLEAAPADFYYENRGMELLHAFYELLPEYPFGAGLGRWGMMYAYFGDPSNQYSPTIWAELQWSAWIVDGGIVLVLLSAAALLAATMHGLRFAIRSMDGRARALAAIIVSINLGLLALTFSYPIFASSMGIQFWFLAGSLHGVLQHGAKPRSVR